MLQKLFTLTGVVIPGKANGRTAGMPTANLRTADEVPCEFGVYATVVHIDGKSYYGVTNFGKRPSVDQSDEITIETYVLDFSGNLYGKNISVDFYQYLRNILKFNSLEEVKQQVETDCQRAIEFFRRMM